MDKKDKKGDIIKAIALEKFYIPEMFEELQKANIEVVFLEDVNKDLHAITANLEFYNINDAINELKNIASEYDYIILNYDPLLGLKIAKHLDKKILYSLSEKKVELVAEEYIITSKHIKFVEV